MFDFIKQYLTTIVAALTIMGLAYLIFWILLRNKLAKKKIQLSKRAGWSQIKGEIGATMLSFIGGTVFSILLLSYNEMGLTKFYLNVNKILSNDYFSPFNTKNQVLKVAK